MADPVIPKFYYDPEQDTNDAKAWSEMDFEDLRNILGRGASIEDVAIFLCRGLSANTRLERAFLNLSKAARLLGIAVVTP